jgi:hypothetical protein
MPHGKQYGVTKLGPRFIQELTSYIRDGIHYGITLLSGFKSLCLD